MTRERHLPIKSVVVRPEDLPVEGWDDARGRLSWVTLFSSDRTPTHALTAGVATLPPGGFLAPHRHEPPEIYVVVAGRGVLTLGDDELQIGDGAAVFIPGNVRHGIRTEGSDVLRFVYTFAVDSFEAVEYRFDIPPASH